MSNSNIFLIGDLSHPEHSRDFFGRLAWYLQPYLTQIDEVVYIHSVAEDFNTIPEQFDPEIVELLARLNSKLEPMTAAELKHRLTLADPTCDVLVLTTPEQESVYQDSIERFRSSGRFYRLNLQYDPTQARHYLWLGTSCWTDQQQLKHEQGPRLQQAYEMLSRHQRVHLLGPDLRHEQFSSLSLPNNTLILAGPDIETVIAPDTKHDLLIFAYDADRHSAHTFEAAQYRSKIRQLLSSEHAYLVCALRDIPLYHHLLPEECHSRVLGAHVNQAGEFNNPFCHLDLDRTAYPLILASATVAQAFARNIFIDGFDINATTAAQQELSSSPTLQAQTLTSLLGEQAELEQLLSTAEDNTVTVTSELHTHLPALVSRQRNVAPRKSSFTQPTLVIIDPDATNEWGHFLAYDQQLAQAAKYVGLDTKLWANHALNTQRNYAEFDQVVRPFSDHTWVYGNRWPDEEPRARARFYTELDSALHRLNPTATQPCLLVMYCGSAQAAEILELVLHNHLHTSVVMNLFYSYNTHLSDSNFSQRYGGVLRRIASGASTVRLFSPTYQAAAEFQQHTNVQLPVLPHPSTTFSDQAARSAPADYHRKLPTEGKFRVMFPGGVRQDKGFLLTSRVVHALLGEEQFVFSVRTRTAGVISNELSETVSTLNALGVDTNDAELTLGKFIQWLNSGDILVLPYPASSFAQRTSGLLIDALILGIPVIVINGTWLANEVIRSQAGLAVAENVESIVAAIRHISEHYEHYVKNARQAAKRHLQQNSWAALLNQILGINQQNDTTNSPSDSSRMLVARQQLQLWEREQLPANTAPKLLENDTIRQMAELHRQVDDMGQKLLSMCAQLRISEGQLAVLESFTNGTDEVGEPLSSSALHHYSLNVWRDASWTNLADLANLALESQPDRAVLALWVALGAAQLGDETTALEYLNMSRAWEVATLTLSKFLGASICSSLARAQLLAGEDESAMQHAQRALEYFDPTANEADAKHRIFREKINLGLLEQAEDDLKKSLGRLHNQNQINNTQFEALDKQLEVLSKQLALHQSNLIKQNGPNKEHPYFSQLGQDHWVLQQTGFKRGGFFVEFGATDGILFSNTYLLETVYGWSGLCAEPNQKFFRRLQRNRQCVVSMDCISNVSGQLVDFVLADEYGGITSDADQDKHAGKRQLFQDLGATTTVETISLDDFLRKHSAPVEIDYISIDTEGSEYEILQSFPFDRWQVKLFTVEHNFAPFRHDLIKLMTDAGYLHQAAQFDDWFYKP